MTRADVGWMRRALEHAASARGATSPNPMVGCVIVRDGAVVGAGHHQRAGAPHAEVNALRDAGDAARGATAYVTLEPCCHHGRTGPCTQALIEAGVARVVAAVRDPNPAVAGRGLDALRDAGVDVTLGVLEHEARRLNEAFFHWIVTGRPFVTLKLATSLDGRIATAEGASQWITGSPLRARVHRMRADSDAVMVGSGTAQADDPRLTVREVAGDWDPPLRIVVDSRLMVSRRARVFAATPPGALVATAVSGDAPRARSLTDAGIPVWSLPGAGRRVDLVALLDRLGAADPPVTSVLVEGGGRIAASLIKAQRVDKLVLHQAPVVIGGDGIGAFAELGVQTPADGPRFVLDHLEQVGEDVELILYPKQA